MFTNPEPPYPLRSPLTSMKSVPLPPSPRCGSAPRSGCPPRQGPPARPPPPPLRQPCPPPRRSRPPGRCATRPGHAAGQHDGRPAAGGRGRARRRPAVGRRRQELPPGALRAGGHHAHLGELPGRAARAGPRAMPAPSCARRTAARAGSCSAATCRTTGPSSPCISSTSATAWPWAVVAGAGDAGRRCHLADGGDAGARGARKADLNLLGLFADNRGRLFAAAEKGNVLRSDDQACTGRICPPATGARSGRASPRPTARCWPPACGARSTAARRRPDMAARGHEHPVVDHRAGRRGPRAWWAWAWTAWCCAATTAAPTSRPKTAPTAWPSRRWCWTPRARGVPVAPGRGAGRRRRCGRGQRHPVAPIKTAPKKKGRSPCVPAPFAGANQACRPGLAPALVSSVEPPLECQLAQGLAAAGLLHGLQVVGQHGLVAPLADRHHGMDGVAIGQATAALSASASKPAMAWADQPDSVAWKAMPAQAAPASKAWEAFGAGASAPGNTACRRMPPPPARRRSGPSPG